MEKTGRKNQPKCENCSHPISFHGGGVRECRALGCKCKTWVAPEPQEDVAPAL